MQRLEQRAAQLTGKDAALLVTSGTQGNLTPASTVCGCTWTVRGCSTAVALNVDASEITRHVDSVTGLGVRTGANENMIVLRV